MSSTVMLTSLEFGKDHNILVTEPYLIYYSLLNASRTVMFTTPNADWKNGEILKATHSKTINIVGDAISQFNKQSGESIKDIIERAKEYRELFSYKFPANGINNFTVESSLAIKICAFLAEFAQLQSGVLETTNFKKDALEISLDNEVLRKGFAYKDEKYDFLDREDRYRLDYISRKQPFPVSLYLTLSKGMVEDFFGAWHHKNDDGSNLYDPDEHCRLIYPFP